MELLHLAVLLVLACVVVLALLLAGKWTSNKSTTDEISLRSRETTYHQGYYDVRNPHKYRGDLDVVIYRSSWEKTAFNWCDRNPKVIAWASEEVVVPYFLKGRRRQYSYFPDLMIHFADKETVMVEIKPKKERDHPSMRNICKWAAARQYCRERGWKFQIWTEDTIAKLRINSAKRPRLGRLR
ncbi:MAG: TnsA endonuclease N-terminal domain-containing protein [Ectothiorhodospiraceae bacterium AqS1]|nr:TnsA endonuclease N-terminal domain-containing protein [Ectothiorhodospiraceae bacterium AqS1]